MAELIERGYVYIAQPPLYKVKKGKQETYIKDDIELNQYLLNTALDNAALHVSADTPPIKDTALYDLSVEYIAVRDIIQRISRKYDQKLIENIMYMPRVSDDSLTLEDLNSWLSELSKRLNADMGPADKYNLQVEHAEESEEIIDMSIVIDRKVHGISNERMLPMSFFEGADYKKIISMGEKLQGLLAEDAYIVKGEKKKAITDFKSALEWLMEEAKRGQHIQRYKGLGEMNPEQLWETTMNPETRRLLRVRIEDAIGSDEIFTTLMGDEVEPRRDFIEKNALTVENLDV